MVFILSSVNHDNTDINYVGATFWKDNDPVFYDSTQNKLSYFKTDFNFNK